MVGGEGAEQNSRTVEAVLEDISALGACVQVEEHIPPGGDLDFRERRIERGPAVLPAGVVLRIPRLRIFRRDSISNETQWSSGVYTEHLATWRL